MAGACGNDSKAAGSTVEQAIAARLPDRSKFATTTVVGAPRTTNTQGPSCQRSGRRRLAIPASWLRAQSPASGHRASSPSVARLPRRTLVTQAKKVEPQERKRVQIRTVKREREAAAPGRPRAARPLAHVAAGPADLAPGVLRHPAGPSAMSAGPSGAGHENARACSFRLEALASGRRAKHPIWRHGLPEGWPAKLVAFLGEPSSVHALACAGRWTIACSRGQRRAEPSAIPQSKALLAPAERPKSPSPKARKGEGERSSSHPVREAVAAARSAATSVSEAARVQRIDRLLQGMFERAGALSARLSRGGAVRRRVPSWTLPVRDPSRLLPA